MYILPWNFTADLFSAPIVFSDLTQDNCVMLALNSKLKYEKLAAALLVVQNTQNLVISRCCFARLQRNVQRFITHVHSYCSGPGCSKAG